jgi:hypothetical protein
MIPLISRIDKILAKFSHKFIDLYVSIYGNLKSYHVFNKKMSTKSKAVFLGMIHYFWIVKICVIIVSLYSSLHLYKTELQF